MNVEEKIKPIRELSRIVLKLKTNGKKVVQCHGIFDIIHPGIINHIESAKSQGNILIATVIKDKDIHKGLNFPIFHENLRAKNAASISDIDYVTLVDDVIPLECVQILKPDIFARGQDYRDRDRNIMRKLELEEESIKVAGCKVFYTQGEVFSSTSIINQFLDIYPENTRNYIKNLKLKYPVEEIIKLLESLKSLKVLIIGDAIIDEYHYCEPMGKSPKANLVVNRYIEDESFAGGTLAVANHVAGICNEVQLLTLLGSINTQEDFIRSKLNPNIETKIFYNNDVSTIVKRRYIDKYLNQKLFEICYINVDELPDEIENQISDYLTEQIPKFDLIMVCDFGHGLVTKKLIHLIESKAKILTVNAQTNGENSGFNMVTQYHNVNFACVDENEARLACHDRHGNILDVAKRIVNSISSDYLIITRGKKGSIGIDSKGKTIETPAFSSGVVDTIGAGDAFYGYTAPCFAKGLSPELIAFIGNAVGALAVQIVCNREPVKPKKLYEFVYALFH